MSDTVITGVTQPPAVSAREGFAHVPLGFRAKSLFATGDAVDGIINFSVVTFVFYYLTAVCGISGAVAGTILAISTVVDAFADPAIGYISDNTHSRWGRRLPYMFISALPAALSFALLFSIPQLAQGWTLWLYTGAVLLTLRVSMSLFTLPYAALGAELSTDYTERSTLFVYRWFFNCTGNLIILTLGFYVFMKGRDGLLDHAAYAGFGWTCGAVALVAALISAFAAVPLRGRLRVVDIPVDRSLTRVIREVREVLANPSFRLLFFCVLLFWTSQGVASLLALHANLYFWKLPSDIIAALPLINLAGFVVGIPITSALLKRFEKRDVSGWGLALACVSQFVPAPLRIMGLLPEGAPLYGLLATMAALGGVAGTCALVSWGSMMADAADEHELLFGSRREGLYFAGLTLSFKAAAGLGGLIGGWALDLIGFPHDVANIGNHPIAWETVRNLGLVQGPVAAIVGITGAVLLIWYRLNKREHGRIQSELARRQDKV